MDVCKEASIASRSEVEVGGGTTEETLAKQPQAEESHENQECDLLPKPTLSESSLSSVSFSSAKSRMSMEDAHEGQENGEVFMNGISQAQEGSPTITSTTSNSICNSFDLDKFHGDHNDERSDDEANFEVSELINEILHQSSYLDDGGLNGLEFVDSLPDALEGGGDDIDVTTSEQVLPIYTNMKDERVSSPDSDSNMTTASEGSSSSTSQLSAASTHASDLLSYIGPEKRKLFKQLISSSEMSEVEFKTQIDGVTDQSRAFDVDNLEVLSLTVPSSTIEKLRALDPVNGLGILEIPADSGILEVGSLEELTSQNGDESKPNVMTEPASSIMTGSILSEETKEQLVQAEDPVVKTASQDERESPTYTQPVAGLTSVCESKLGNCEGVLPSENPEERAVTMCESGDMIESLEDINLPNSLVKEGPKFISDIGETLAALETLSLDGKVMDGSAEMQVSQVLCSSEVTEAVECEGGDTVKDDNSIKSEVAGEKLVSSVDETLPVPSEVEKLQLPSDVERLQIPAEEKAENNAPQNYDCACKRSEASEDGGSVIVGVWAELRSSLRQLHRSMIPQSTQGSAHRSRPSINRIKALANMLMSHDAHQLYLRISHLAHELCIELKVRLLATIHDNPTAEDAASFIQGVCDSYQWVMSVCEALHPALERLDSEHLSRFKLNWVTLNMHIFHATILTEPDVQDYTNICKQKLSGAPGGEDVIGCLASLHRTLSLAEAVWLRADALLQDYAVERAALSARRRQLLADWEQFKAQQRNHQKEQATKNGEEGVSQCPCSDCAGNRGVTANSQPDSTTSKLSLSSMSDIRPPSSCECHFCNSSIGPPSTEEPVLPTSSGNSLPPLAQPQLSLYPHIHSTPPGSDIVGAGQSREEMGPVPPPPTTKPPITTNPYLGSDLLTEQLMREWELVYGDALTPPGSHPILPPPDAVLPHYQGDPASLVSGVETLHISSTRPSYTRTMVDPSLPYVPDSHATARAHTTILPSSQPTTFPMNHSVSTSGHKVPSSSSRSTTPVGDSCCSLSSEVPSSAVKCCSATNTTSVITHTRAHHTHTTAAVQKSTSKCVNGIDDSKKRHMERVDQSTSRESIGESETSGGDEWSSGDESDSSATVSSTHQDPHCDCCYCHMLHHKQDGGRQKYSDRRDRLLQILSRKKKARNSLISGTSTATAHTTAAVSGVPSNGSSVPTSKGGSTPLGGQNINKILDFIEGNQIDEAKHAKKAAKKARQKQKKMAIRREEEEEEEYEDDEFEEKNCDGDDVEDGPLAELRRRAPDVTITVVRPGQQTPRTPASPQMGLGKPRDSSPPSGEAYKTQAKLVPSLVQNSKEPSPPTSRTILQPSRPSNHQSQQSNQRGRNVAVAPTPVIPGKSSNLVASSGQEVSESPPTSAGYTGLSNILKGMETLGKEKEKGSQMVTIRRVMDPNNAEPTVTITLKGEKPEKDKVLFKLVNGQAVSGNGSQSGQIGKKGGGGVTGGGRTQRIESNTLPDEPPIPEGLSPEEIKKYKKKQKKERQRQKKIQEQIEEQQKGRMQQLELQKQQELLRQQQEQIRQKQLALQRQEEELIKQQQNKNNSKKGKKKNGKVANSTINSNNNSKNSKLVSKGADRVSAVVYDGDDMAQSFNLPPGVTINKVAGQPGMVTISNNMGGAFSQPFLPNPNVYPSPVLQGYPVLSAAQGSLPKPCSRGQNPGLSWNSAVETNYPDKDNVIVVDTNNGFLGTTPISCSSPKREITSDEKVVMAVKGIIDPSTLNMTQKKKFKKMKKALQEEKERAEQKQREEDDLMDQMYNIVNGKSAKNGGKMVQGQLGQGKSQAKKNQKVKENIKPPSAQAVNNCKQVLQQVSTKVSKQQQSQKVSENQKQKQPQELVLSVNNKNNTKQGKEVSQPHIISQTRKNSTSSQQGKLKQQQPAQQSQLKQPVQQKQPLKQQKTPSQQKQKQHQKGLSQVQQQQQPQQQQQQSHQALPQKQSQQQQKSSQQQVQKQKQQHLKQNQEQKQQVQPKQAQQRQSLVENQSTPQQKKHTNHQGKMPLATHEKHTLNTNHNTNTNNIGNYSNSIAFPPPDIAHEARYAQYLAANASTLAKMSYTCNLIVPNECTADHCAGEKDKKSGKTKKYKKKKGHLEDMTTIDSVFTPKDIVEGELDETERDVEAFKRFCFNNVPRHAGEKPKVNFNVKDIMIKKRPCNVNL
ncbi:uncharacterized protein [Macrobrachium rosenbergii]|uniref:uncharacterized protein n=1 Tax=Macrobrachium rosenbergii TaxID=79674 RepID=UPI0034D4379B